MKLRTMDICNVDLIFCKKTSTTISSARHF